MGDASLRAKTAGDGNVKNGSVFQTPHTQHIAQYTTMLTDSTIESGAGTWAVRFGRENSRRWKCKNRLRFSNSAHTTHCTIINYAYRLHNRVGSERMGDAILRAKTVGDGNVKNGSYS